MGKHDAVAQFEGNTNIMDGGSAAGLIGTVTPDDFRRYTEQGAVFERSIKLAENQKVEGRYVGPGVPREFTDDGTGEIKVVNTHRFEVAQGQVATINGAAQLDRQLKDLVGQRVVVIRGKDVNIAKGHRMTEYFVSALPE